MSKKRKRRKGSTRSKAEKSLVKVLRKQIKGIKITPNAYEVCGYDIDVCVPDHKLAIEWNGILHREPLFGIKKLSSIQTNDAKKREILMDMGWTMVIVHDIDSKKPLQYAKKVAAFVKELLDSESLLPSTVYELTVGKSKAK